jgi:hypothetical protein
MAFVVDPVTFVVAVNNRQILAENFLLSPLLTTGVKHQVILQEGFKSAARAYNDAVDRSINDVIVLLHQDVSLPGPWLAQLQFAIDDLATTDPGWGVLGCYGETLTDNGRGYIFSPGRGLLGRALARPEEVQTLDELLLIVRKSAGLRFDERIPHFHFYGADLCMAAARKGMRSYAIPALCIHNAQHKWVLPKEFYESYRVFKELWRDWLPVQTTCLRVTASNLPLYKRRLQEAYLRYLTKKEFGPERLPTVRGLLESFEPSNHTGIGRDLR